MEISINRVNEAVHFEIENASQATISVDGAPAIGGEDKGLRPMELVLAALATCGAFELVTILKKQKQNLQNLNIKVIGERKEGKGARSFSHIAMVFTIDGEVKKKKAERALDLAFDKYCSVRASLDPEIEVSYEVLINPSH
ncbi:MAG: OsmC family peroxiredoxin [Bacteroidetes bacterium]|nr:OsmC family peroxiredoxin [Bacteroidota bacterium]